MIPAMTQPAPVYKPLTRAQQKLLMRADEIWDKRAGKKDTAYIARIAIQNALHKAQEAPRTQQTIRLVDEYRRTLEAIQRAEKRQTAQTEECIAIRAKEMFRRHAIEQQNIAQGKAQDPAQLRRAFEATRKVEKARERTAEAERSAEQGMGRVREFDP